MHAVSFLPPAVRPRSNLQLAEPPIFKSTLCVIRRWRSERASKKRAPLGPRCFSVVAEESATRFVDEPLNRRRFVRDASIFLSIYVLPWLPRRQVAKADDLVKHLIPIVQARQALDGVDSLIKAGKWDGVRTILGKAPFPTLKKELQAAASQISDPDAEGDAEDVLYELLDDIGFLDDFCYTNVFIGEERQVLGTKIDYETPLLYWRQSVEKLEAFLALVDEGAVAEAKRQVS
mmetsp:Transcript_27577/g.47608  ORF Transcript_27577/g.47608 Transcript_27577/m.47608 type:complete len:233 (-) Transcript_27577:136-834(-)|eukprot:CAMPEP_0196657024 /NCGR_PEP_ID=MMETSP1086-20130531/21291_1 /TAXON_ID=77921 /ORGANISM="Cyanoptyche  gloeocystis , Strain SAG4.97" /LENGTH=232 /DNA_ID=CAMNT_0041990009 /DNA_START=28 /DNA_END=726 /DNA_ORIENTATION=-